MIGLANNDCRDPSLRGVWVVNAGSFGGYFTNGRGSYDPTLFVEHGDDNKFEIGLGGGFIPPMWFSGKGNGGVIGNFSKERRLLQN